LGLNPAYTKKKPIGVLVPVVTRNHHSVNAIGFKSYCNKKRKKKKPY